MARGKYKRFLQLPIGTDFENVSGEKLSFRASDVKRNKDDVFGAFTSAATMRFKEIKAVQKTLNRLLKETRITPEMADHVRNIPVEHVFCANKMLCVSILEHVSGQSSNAFISTDDFNKGLEEFGFEKFS